jgi:hypothetical protein
VVLLRCCLDWPTPTKSKTGRDKPGALVVGFFAQCVPATAPIVLQPCLCFQEYGLCHHLALAGSNSTSGVGRLNCQARNLGIVCAGTRGNSNEKGNRELGSRSSADVVGSEGRGTRRRRCAGGRIGCHSAGADRSRGWRSGGLYGRPVDFTFLGPAPLERIAPGAESREPGRSCPCRRQSACTQSVSAQRSSSSSSGCPSAAVRHHHGFHCAAGPATGMSRD